MSQCFVTTHRIFNNDSYLKKFHCNSSNIIMTHVSRFCKQRFQFHNDLCLKKLLSIFYFIAMTIGGHRHPEGVYTIVDPYGFTKSLFTIASALDFLWRRGMVHCRLLAVWTRTHQSADLYFVMVTSEEAKPIDFKIYRLSIDFQVVWIYWWIRPQAIF
jgi:hypothetical protein